MVCWPTGLSFIAFETDSGGSLSRHNKYRPEIGPRATSPTSCSPSVQGRPAPLVGPDDQITSSDENLETVQCKMVVGDHTELSRLPIVQAVGKQPTVMIDEVEQVIDEPRLGTNLAPAVRLDRCRREEGQEPGLDPQQDALGIIRIAVVVEIPNLCLTDGVDDPAPATTPATRTTTGRWTSPMGSRRLGCCF